MYSPKEYQEWQKEALAALHAVHPPCVFQSPVLVEVTCFVRRPKTSKLLIPKPDVDNYAKGVLDAITKDGRFWSDDTEVSDLISRKRWTTGDPHVAVAIVQLEPKDL
jgi:Holliday junction resolvase RusA-like endonuclease